MKKHKLLIAVIMFGLTWAGIVRAEDQPIEQQTKPTILLVHGAWADSSSWNGVVDLLLKDGYTRSGRELHPATGHRAAARKRIQACHLCDVVDQGRHPGIHPAFMDPTLKNLTLSAGASRVLP
jgi:hypothetical protein